MCDRAQQDATFHCHKTTISDERGGRVAVAKSTLCIGAAIFLENTLPGGMLGNLGFRLGCMMEQISPSELSNEIPVYSHAEEFMEGVCWSKVNKK